MTWCIFQLTVSSTAFQSSASYSCKTGFTSNQNSSEIFCGSNGEWSDTLFTCKPVDCMEPKHISFTEKEYNSTTYNSYVFYSCAENYDIVSGAGSKVCQETGEWSSGSLQCVKRMCDPPTDIDNGHFSPILATYFVNTVITYSCKYLFYMVGVANSQCQGNSLWSNKPKCFPVTCPTYVFTGGENIQIQVNYLARSKMIIISRP